MTLRGLVLRFTIAYVISLFFGIWLAVFFANKNAMVITTAALLASTLYVCHLFIRRNERLMTRREILLAWLAFLFIHVVLQAVTILSFVGTWQENVVRLQQFAAGGLVFTILFHGVCIYAFIWMAGKISARKASA